MWLTLFRLGEPADERHPAGLYGAAWVEYVDPSPLRYGELLLARATRTSGGGFAATITDIWVDSEASRAGGRALWAIPKQLCRFDLDRDSRGPVGRTRWSAADGHGPLAAARFTDVSRAAVRAPFRGTVTQPGLPEHPEPATVRMSGSARSLPCRARWELPAAGPLGLLRGARQLGSFRLAGLRLTFD